MSAVIEETHAKLERYLADHEFRQRGPNNSLEKYLGLDDELCRLFFGGENAGVPVFLDMEPEVFELLGDRLGMSAAEAQSYLIKQVGRLVAGRNDEQRAAFSNFDNMLAKWATKVRVSQRKGEGYPPPPLIALLCVLSLAAERMGNTEVSELHDNAYYPQLLEMFGLPADEKTRFITSFRKTSERYWSALASWLEDHDGEFGLPSAFALSHRYVGLPKSQALIRGKERKTLKRIFAENGLPPGQLVGYGEMESAIDQWLHAHSAASTLNKIWTSDELKERVVQIAIEELAAWDGVSEETFAPALNRPVSSSLSNCMVIARDESDIFEEVIEFGFAVSRSTLDQSNIVRMRAADEAIELRLQAMGPGYASALCTSVGLEPSSLLSGQLEIELPGGSKVQRFPRPVFPMHRDQMTSEWLEVERVAIGEDARIVVQANEGFPEVVEQILDQVARPGFKRIDSPQLGVPTGWVVFDEVQVLAAPLENESVRNKWALNVLMPRLATRISLTGGLRLPGRSQRWSRLNLPRVTVTSERESPLTLVLIERYFDKDDWEEVLVNSANAPFDADLGDDLEKGDYTLELRDGDKPIQAISLRVRDSSDRDALSWRGIRNLGHFKGDPLWVFRAGPGPDAEAAVSGANVSKHALVSEVFEDPVELERLPHWAGAKPLLRRRPQLFLPNLPADSCIRTGRHHEVIPKSEPGKPKDRFVQASCKKCGQKKWYPTEAWLADAERRNRGRARRTAERGAELKVEFLIDQVHSQEVTPVVDAIRFAGAGEFVALEKLVRTIENNALFASDFIKSLDQSAMVEIERDDRFRPVAFEVGDAAIVRCTDQTLLLTGYWTPQNIEAMGAAVGLLGAGFTFSDQARFGLPSIRGVSDPEAVECAPVIIADVSSGSKILDALPTLKEAAERIQRVAMPGWTRIDRFDVETAHWVNSTSALVQGAYRIQTEYGTTYVFRSSADISTDQALIADAATVKHLAAAHRGRPLMAYDGSDQVLSVPMGAELPGLYGRAAVLCGGYPTRSVKSTFSIEYSGVPAEFASALYQRLV